LSRLRTTIPAALAAAVVLSLPAQAASGTTMLVKDDFFSPKSKTIAKGTQLTLKWQGVNPHDVVAKKGSNKIWRIGVRDKGTVRRRFNTAGTYKLICTIHEGMTATVKVR